MIAEIRAGNAPNIGRFCGYCSAPLGNEDSCGVCGETTERTPAVDKIDRDLAQIYHAKRKREGLYVHLAAWTGILLATGLSILMILFLPGWTKVFASSSWCWADTSPACSSETCSSRGSRTARA